MKKPSNPGFLIGQISLDPEPRIVLISSTPELLNSGLKTWTMVLGGGYYKHDGGP